MRDLSKSVEIMGIQHAEDNARSRTLHVYVYGVVYFRIPDFCQISDIQQCSRAPSRFLRGFVSDYHPQKFLNTYILGLMALEFPCWAIRYWLFGPP